MSYFQPGRSISIYSYYVFVAISDSDDITSTGRSGTYLYISDLVSRNDPDSNLVSDRDFKHEAATKFILQVTASYSVSFREK